MKRRAAQPASFARPLIRLYRLPIYVTPIAREMIEPMAALPSVKGFSLQRLLNPLWAGSHPRQAEPEAIPVPYVLRRSFDTPFFSRVGIHTCGFTPMNLPEEFSFFETIHHDDERIPIVSAEFGTDVLYRLIEHYGD